jgi:glucan biosynthesis protein C
MDYEVERRHDMDWLRFFAMCAVFFFHCGRFFDDGGWQVKNHEVEFGITLFTKVLAQWIMPIFFILSGSSTYYSLRAGKQKGLYVWERVKRLIVPLIFGIFTMIPLQVYCDRVNHGKFIGSLIDFYPHYFEGFYEFGGNFAWTGLHLWYLLFLFIFTVLSLPLFVLLGKSSGRQFVAWVAKFSLKPGVIFLFFIPVAMVDFGVLPITLLEVGDFNSWNVFTYLAGFRDFGSWNLFTYLLWFVFGYIFAGDGRFTVAFQRYRRNAVVGSAATIVLLFCWILFSQEPRAGYSIQYLLFAAIRSLNSWCFLIVLLGYGSKYLSFPSGILSQVNPLVLPFYILHQTVIIGIGFYVVQWEASIGVKYFVISVTSLALILSLYEVVIKRVGVLRFLFGMK